MKVIAFVVVAVISFKVYDIYTSTFTKEKWDKHVLGREKMLTDMLIKTWPVPVRTICMFVSVIVTIVVFIVAFQWFPVEKVMAWVMFLCCFVVCALGAIGISLLKEKTDNRKMQEALERMQNGKNETDSN